MPDGEEGGTEEARRVPNRMPDPVGEVVSELEKFGVDRRQVGTDSTPFGILSPGLGSSTLETRQQAALEAVLQTQTDPLPVFTSAARLPPHSEFHMAGGDDEVHSFDLISVYDQINMRPGWEDETNRSAQEEITARSGSDVQTQVLDSANSAVQVDTPIITLESETPAVNPTSNRIRAEFAAKQGEATNPLIRLALINSSGVVQRDVRVIAVVDQVGDAAEIRFRAQANDTTFAQLVLQANGVTNVGLATFSGTGTRIRVTGVDTPSLAADAVPLDFISGGIAAAPFVTLGLSASLSAEISILEADESDLPDDDIRWKWNSASTRQMIIENIGAGGANLFILDGGGIVVGHTAKIDFGAIPEFQVLGTATPDSSMGFARFENNASGPDVRFLKSRGITVGANTIVQDGDALGRFRFQGADGFDFNTTAAEIIGQVDGSPSLNDIPGRIVFRTRLSGGALADKMIMDNAGQLQVLITGSGAGLLLGGDTQLFRGAANRLDLASGDSLRLVSGTLETDTIAEVTAAAGITIDNVTVKDGSVELHHGTDTISTDQITAPTGGLIIAAAETGATDDLDGIGGGANGRIIVVTADAGDTITLKHNNAGATSGNRLLLNDDTDRALVGADQDSVIFMYDESLLVGAGAWFEIAGSSAHTKYLDSEAIAAVEGEATLDLAGDVKIANGKHLIVGHSAQLAIGEVTSEFQVLGTTETDASLVVGLFNATNALAPVLKLYKSGSGSIGANFITVADNEELGKVQAYGADGTDADTLVAEIAFNVDDASIAAGQIGGEIVLATATSGGTLTPALTIGADQGATFAGYAELIEIAAPGAGAASRGRIYVQDVRNLTLPRYVSPAGEVVDLGIPWEYIEFPGWLASSSGTAGTDIRPRRANLFSGVTANSTVTYSSIAIDGWTPGVAKNVIDWTQPIMLYIVLNVDDETSTGIFRLSLGTQQSESTGDFSHRGIGIKVANLTLTGEVHDGTGLTSTSLTTLTADRAHRILIVSDGAGNVEWFVDGVAQGSTTGGPSAAGTAGDSGFQIDLTNGANSAAYTVTIHYAAFAVLL